MSDDNEKQNILTDVQPVIGKNPIVPAKWGYHKIPIDLRQVPEEFIKSSSHEYIYLSYKTDELFFVCQRHIDIIRAFFEL